MCWCRPPCRRHYSTFSKALFKSGVTVLGKRRVPSLLKDLQQGLLDQSVNDARYAEALVAIGWSARIRIFRSQSRRISF